jgi:predicted ATPase
MKFIPIKTIKARNFKSFEDIEINLSEFNVVIGPNSGGKSNFLSILQFFRDIVNFGVENAISLQGGLDYMINRKDNIMEIEIAFTHIALFDVNKSKKFAPHGFSYKIQFALLKKSRKLRKYKYTEIIELELNDNSKASIHNNNGKIVIDKELNNLFGGFISVVSRGISNRSIISLMPIISLFDRENVPQI